MTDRTEILLGPSGWVHASDESGAPSDRPLVALSPEEIGKIQGTLEITNYGWLEFSLHNGTNRQLREMVVELLIDAQGAQEMTKRDYKLPVHKGDPLSAFTINAKCGCQLLKGQGYSWRILGAKAE